MGVVHIYANSIRMTIAQSVEVDIDTAYYSISLSLNVILTLMIIVRLVLHRRNVRRAVGTSGGTTGLYTTIVIMLVESYALYAISLLLYIVPLALNSPVQFIFSKTLGELQVCAAYLLLSLHARTSGCCLIFTTNRSLLLISSFYELPRGEH